MSEQFQLRDVFTPTRVNKLAHDIGHSWPEFDETGFTTTINTALEPLSFGDRNALIRDTLHQYLPDHFPDAVQILINALGPELPSPELTGYDGFLVMSQCDFVAMYGLEPEHYDISMQALYEMTKRFTAEGAIRTFIKTYPDQTLRQLEIWSHDENCHVRRLVSEGTRPRLPMTGRLPQFIADPRPVLKLLDNLKVDPVLLVRRSVANNLNDIAKDNPDVVVETLQEWQKINNEGTRWLIQHASRTLLKQGNKEALALLGYLPHPAIKVQNLTLKKQTIQMGDNLLFNFDILSEAPQTQNLMIDYVIHHMKANGKLAPKVFKLAKKKLKAGERLTLAKKHSFRPISTRKYYAGQHRLEIQINGDIWAEAGFELSLEAKLH